MEGIYKVTKGQDRFGRTAVLRWSRQYLSLFFGVNAGYFINEAGHNNSEVLIEGYSKRSKEHLQGRNSANKVVVFPAGNNKAGDYVKDGKTKVEKEGDKLKTAIRAGIDTYKSEKES